jgi:hypothetical protein
MLCSLVAIYQLVAEINYFHLQEENMEATDSSETLITTYKIKKHNNSEENIQFVTI